jgi:hypothetical protein
VWRIISPAGQRTNPAASLSDEGLKMASLSRFDECCHPVSPFQLDREEENRIHQGSVALTFNRKMGYAIGLD